MGPKGTGFLYVSADAAELRERHGLIVKFVEAHYFNGIRLSPHVFNAEDEIDFAIDTIRNALA